MIHVDASQAIRELRRLHKSLSQQEVNRAIALAFNATLSKQRTFLRRRIQAKYPDSALRASGYNSGKGIVIERANRSKLFARLSVSSKRIPLRYFGAKQIGTPGNGQGVSVEVTKGSRKTLPFAFFVKGRMPKAQVMSKGNYTQGRFDVRRKRKSSTGPDLPITSLVGTKVGQPDRRDWGHAEQRTLIELPKQLSSFFEKIASGKAR